MRDVWKRIGTRSSICSAIFFRCSKNVAGDICTIFTHIFHGNNVGLVDAVEFCKLYHVTALTASEYFSFVIGLY